jgi:hypothetical protein
VSTNSKEAIFMRHLGSSRSSKARRPFSDGAPNLRSIKFRELKSDDFVLEPLVIIREAKTFTQLPLENPHFLLMLFDDCWLSAVHPPGTANQQDRQPIHRRTIPL